MFNLIETVWAYIYIEYYILPPKFAQHLCVCVLVEFKKKSLGFYNSKILIDSIWVKLICKEYYSYLKKTHF